MTNAHCDINHPPHDLVLVRPVGFALVVALSACNPFQCTYETRFIGSAGTTNAARGAVVVEYVNFRQYHADGPVPSAVMWQIRGEQLASPPARLTLRNAQGQAVVDLTMQSSSAVSVVASGSTNVSGAAQDPMFDLIASGTAVVTLELQDGTTLSVSLLPANLENWHHPECD